MKEIHLAKRTLALLCAVLLAISAVPLGAYAEGEINTGLYGLDDELELNLDTTSTTELIVTRGTDLGTDAAIVWESSDDTVAKVAADPADSTKATVTAEKAGTTTITASATAIDGSTVTDTCVITVKSLPTAVTAKLEEGLDEDNVSATEGSFRLEAELTPAAEYCTEKTVTWSVTAGASYVELNNAQVTLKELPGSQDEVSVTFRASTVNGKTDDITVTIKKAVPTVTVGDLDICYGDAPKTLSTVVGGTENTNVTYTQISGDEIAAVTEDGTVTPKKAGTFQVKAYFGGDGRYKAAESEVKELTVKPRTLQVELSDSTAPITKESDGTAKLTEVNKNEVKNRVRLVADQLVGTDGVNLTVAVPDTIVYSNTGLGSNTIELDTLVIGMETEDSNYKLDTDAVTSVSLPAVITAKVPGTATADMIMASADVNLDSKDIILQSGIQGADHTYWHDGKGVPVTLPAGTTLIDSSGDAAAAGGYLTAESDEEFYVNQNEVYYGPYTVTYQKDSAAPVINLESVQADGNNVDGVVFDKTVIYTVTVTDTGSGVKGIADGGIQYGIASENSEDTVETWSTPDSLSQNGDTYTFQVRTEGNGYLFVKATDRVENESCESIRAIVLESQKPEITVSADNPAYRQTHTVSIETKDADATGTSPYGYSGIKKIVYELKQGEELVYTAAKTNSVPGDISELPGVRTLNDSITNLQTGNYGSYDGQPLDGTYTLTATAYDNCGNSQSASCTLNFDNTAPEYTVTMTGGREDAEGNYYYRADNCGLTVNVTDDRAADGLTYDIKVGTVQKNDTRNSNGSISFTAAEIAVLSDGSIPVTVTVTDAAGNRNTKYAETNGITGLKGTDDRTEAAFVLDKTAPVVTAVTSNGTAKGPYDGDDYYYNETDLTVTFAIQETNAADDSWSASVKKDGSAAACAAVSSNQVEFALSSDGKYTEFTVSGQDLAGNPLKLADNLTLGDTETDREANQVQAAGDVPGENGTVTMQKNKVVDHVAPVAVITYTTAKTDHMYTDAAGYTAAAYYNTDITASVTVTDSYGTTPVALDASKLYFGNTGTYAAAGSTSSETTADASYTWNLDGEYYAGAYGTDRAGNALTVKEQIPDTPAQYVTQENQATGYTSGYLLIRDTVQPEYTLDIQSGSSSIKTKNTQGNRYYFNSAFAATVAITEDHYDADRIYVCRGFLEASDEVDSQTAELTENFSETIAESEPKVYTDTVSAGEGIYRYRMYGTDRAGNELVPSADQDIMGVNAVNLTGETQSLTEADFTSAAQMDKEEAADLSVHVVLDTVKPVIDVSVTEDKEGGEIFYTAQLTSEEAYEVSRNLPYRSVSKAKAVIEETDFSPVQLDYAFETSNTGAANTNGAYHSSGYVKNDSQTAAFDGQQRMRITELKATDLAGNSSTATAAYDGAVSTWMYLDVEPPVYDELAPTVTMKLSGTTTGKAKGSVYGPDGNALYTSDVTAEVTIEDPNQTIKASGLYKVYYKVQVNGEDWTSRGLVAVSSSTDSGVTATKANGLISYGTSGAGSSVTGNEKLTYKDQLKFTFKTADFNYNDVKLTVWAEDNSGNVIAESSRVAKGFGIDITRPTIKVRYDNNDVKNERYFNADRTATIEVTERNFDADHTTIDTQSAAKISSWKRTAGAAPNGDADIWSCTVTWDTDGDYTFDVDTQDLAGNTRSGNVDYGDSAAPADFTIDKTIPVITITFDNENVRNGKYYNAFRTATIEILEHNFDGDDAVVTVTADIAEGTAAVPGITGWRSSNDRNVTTVPFRADGDYTMQVEYTDLAGNEAEVKKADDFTVDTTAPVIEIGGVEENSANQGEVAPSITYHDINYDASLTAVSIVGYKNKDGKNLNGTAQETAFGGSFVCRNIEEIPENDDVYLCTGHVEDLAGNSSEAELRFSVNRFGSNYILDDPTEALVENYYTNAVPEIHITEINVNTLEFQEITATQNGEIVELEEGHDYQVEEDGDEYSWKEYRYTISSDYFQEDGVYNITVHSRDAAENENSNRTARVPEYSKPIDFVLDTTNPETVISGVENDAQYVENSRIVTIYAEDNIRLKELQLYLDGELAASYEEEELAETAGTVTYQAESKNNWQELKVVTEDKAGNRTEQEVRFLLTTNLWIQYIHNTPLVIGTVAVIAGFIFLLILWKRRKKSKEEGAE